MLHVYNDPPIFVSGSPVSAIDLETLRKNAHAMYNVILGLSVPVMQQSIDRRNLGATGNMSSGITGGGWLKFYHGAFQFHTGMDKFRFEMYYEVPVQPSADNFKIYFKVNDAWVLQGTQSLAANTTGNVAWEFDVDTQGFQENEIVEIQVDYDKPGAPAEYPPSHYHFKACFVYPVTLASWPGIPSLSGTAAVSESALNQLSLACDWLMRRINLLPQLPITATLLHTMSFIRGTLPPDGAFWHVPDQSMWSGGAVFANQNTRFKIGGKVTFKDAQERYILYRDNVAVDYWPSSSTYSTPYTTTTWELEDTQSVPASSHYRVGNILLPNTGGNDDPNAGTGRTRHNFDFARVENVGGLTPATWTFDNTVENVSRTNMTYATLRNRLLAISEMFEEIYNYIAANPLVFARAYITRPMMAVRDEDYEWLYKWSMYRFEKRRGTVLWLRGKGVRVSYGPITVKHQEQEFDYEFKYDEEVIPGDQVQSTFVYLDTLPGLFHGMPYYVRGKFVAYAAESFR